ncbi:MAG: bifunctional [glutamate--ammonia ligase]-adenylyl-L-tyrosine phosphorylase/[glutamate--ammonia-ligase] adenylyltransferase [Porticoccaceae bacterium]
MTVEINNLISEIRSAGMPEEILALGKTRLASFCDRHVDSSGHWLLERLGNADFVDQLIKVWGCSGFVYETCLTWPHVLEDLCASGDLGNAYTQQSYREKLAARIAGVDDEKALHRVLRQFRRREMVRMVWRDFARLAPMLETTGDVTRLAEACIGEAISFLHPLIETQLGTPIGKYSGQPQQLVVLGMGKMGAWELNLSSDIDLIFTFPEDGQTRDGRKQVSNQEFFTRLAQKLIQALDNNTVDGFVFRVDMRLRPYGDSGSLVLNFDAMEEYYQSQGRDWERYAMIKARVVAGRAEDGAALMAILRPFTYRKYIDFTAIQSLRDMKALINREVARLGVVDDVKKSAGGIREIEFIAQAFQLIRGGKDLHFQNPSLQAILQLLDSEKLLPCGEADKLWSAYEFLRNTEHAIQGMADKQTQLLPQDEQGRAAVAAVMGFSCWSDFYQQLESHRNLVKSIFADIAAEAPQENPLAPPVQAAKTLWLGAEDTRAFAEELVAMGFAEAEAIAALLLGLRESRTVKALTAAVRERLDRFVPLLLSHCAAQQNGDLALVRIVPLVEAILRRSAYLVLMTENPDALRQLVYLCSESSWIGEQIGRYPALLDELLDVRTLFTPADKQSISQELRQLMLRIPTDDLEAQMEALRYFRRAQGLRIAACEVEGALPLMKVSDNLTWLAEVILEQVLAMAWEWMIARHGHPGKADAADPDPGLLVVGYGKLGGIELGHGSDLDLVFLHNANVNLYSDGERSIDNNSYFMRLCQRLIHILSTQTVGGDLYEVDTRLRPNGNSGLLVTSLDAFAKYQLENAWTWEHQALVRARPVAGDDQLAAEFARIRDRVLCQRRDRQTLCTDVLEMRDKMRAHLGSKPGGDTGVESFNIKQDSGGIVDIEFIVQYSALLYASEFPALIEYTDNMRILDAIRGSELLPVADVEQLQECYIFLRSLGHRLNLQGKPSAIDAHSSDWSRASDCRRQVAAVWDLVFGGQ